MIFVFVYDTMRSIGTVAKWMKSKLLYFSSGRHRRMRVVSKANSAYEERFTLALGVEMILYTIDVTV